MNEDCRIEEFEEKPMVSPYNTISTGIYVIRRRQLIELIEKAAQELSLIHISVKRLSSNTLALTTLIKVWHDYIHAAGLSSNSCNYTLQILIMIIWGHQVGVFANWI